MPTTRQVRLLKLIVTNQGTSECVVSSTCVDSMRPALAGSGSLAGGVVHVSESWLFYYGAAGSVLSRALDAELCRSRGAVQVVGVERGERRGDAIPSLPALRQVCAGRPTHLVPAILGLGLGLGYNNSVAVSW